MRSTNGTGTAPATFSRFGFRRQLHPPTGPDHSHRADARHVPGRPGPDDRRLGDPHDRRRSGRPVDPGVGHYRLPDHLDHLHAAVRQAVRPLWAEAVLPVRHQHIHRRDRRPRPSRPRCTCWPCFALSRGWAQAASFPWLWRSWATSSRPGSEPDTRATSWPCSARPACLARSWAGSSRAEQHPRHSGMALGIPGQRADRAGGSRRRVVHAQHSGRAPRGADRLVRRAGPDRLPCSYSGRRRAGEYLGLGLRLGPALLRYRRAGLAAASWRRSTAWAMTR